MLLLIILCILDNGVLSQDICDNPDFIVTEDLVFDCLTYPRIPE